MLEFGKKTVDGVVVLDDTLWKNNEWRINSIVINEAGLDTEYSFDLNGGSVNGATTLSPVKTLTGETYGTLPTPKKEGYTFLGWYLNPNGKGNAVTSSTVVKNNKPHTLYAVYKVLRLNYDFTTADQLEDIVNIQDDANYEIVTDDSGTYLKLSAKSGKTAHFTLSNILLPAGSSVEFDVEFVGTCSKEDKNNRAGFFLYGAKENGMNITSGALGVPGLPGTPDHVNKWYWGQGYHSMESSSVWKDGKFTINAQILEDSHGVYVYAQMGNSSQGYWKITAIRITLAD